MQTIVSQYSKLLQNLSSIIDISGYRNDYVAKKLGMKPQSFSLKKQKVNWTPIEVEKILKVIENEDVRNFLDTEIIQSHTTDNTISSDEFETIMGWK
jgi:hypothetical protein